MEQTPAQWTASTVRAELARRRISASRLCRDLDWSKATISRRLNGVTPFSVTELVAIADYLEVPAGDLLRDTAAA